jgi:hypothetical protein
MHATIVAAGECGGGTLLHQRQMKMVRPQIRDCRCYSFLQTAKRLQQRVQVEAFGHGACLGGEKQHGVFAVKSEAVACRRN